MKEGSTVINGVQLFAKVDNHLVHTAYDVFLITVGTFTGGEFKERDVVLYRSWRRCVSCGHGKYEIIRFNPVHKTAVRGFFPHGPPVRYNGSPWVETTDWLNPVTTVAFPINGGNFIRVDNCPQNLPPHFYL